MTITIAATEDDARRALESAGIDDPGPKYIRLAQRALENAEKALNNDPDTKSSERGHEFADCQSMNASAIIRDTPEMFDMDDEGLAGEDASPREKVEAAHYVVFSRIVALAIEENRPSMDDVDWDDAQPRAGYVLVGKSEAEGFIYVRAELRDRNGHHDLSIVGDTRDGGGQIDMHLSADDFEPAPGWSAEDLAQLWAIWDRWHLNGMNAHCEHQGAIADRMGRKPFEVFATSNARVDETGHYTGGYGRGVDGKQASRARVVCSTCGYSYGSQWRREELPADVVDFLRARFPAFDR